MAEGEEEIIKCYSCGALMNVAAHPPYSRVICPSCKTENRVKKQFGPYVLNRRHAIGGMSSVFIATDSTLDREVALKILSEEYSSDSKRIAAFEEEARLTASFSHPNVVRVFTTGKAFGRLYIAMEFVPGGHFEHHIRERGRIPETEILPFAIQVAEGLKGAQAAGLIHRDVKPGNILLDSEGHAKIVDFGLALVTQGGKAKAEEIWATPYYVPPEAIDGSVEDFRADIYAFGATFYHALAGKPPCNEESMATDVLREAKRRIVPLGKAAPDLTEETCAVIDRAMAFDPINRFSSYDEMIAALHTALKVANGEAVRDGDGVTKAQRRLELRRAKLRKSIIAGAAAVLCIAVLGAVIAVNRPNPAAEIPKPKVLTVEKETSETGAEEYRIAESYQAARAAMKSGDLSLAETRFSSLLQDAAVQEPTRTWAGLEAVVAAMMDGRMNDARKHAAAVNHHIKAAPSEIASGFLAGVAPVLDHFADHDFFDSKELNLDSQGNERHMGSLIAGLKNWEQGGMDQALPFLQAFASESSLSGDGVLSYYQEVARVYLRDHEQLKSSAMEATPENPAACQDSIEELNRLLTLLKTKGRARFNVRARQLDLTKLERVLSQVPSPQVDVTEEANTEILGEIESLAKQYNFQSIVEKLTEMEGDPPGCKRASLLILAQSALRLFPELNTYLTENPVDLSLKLVDATSITSLVFREEKLFSKTEDGEVREIQWTDLAADQILELNRELIERSASETDRNRRQEIAIAFDWLAGDRARALSSAQSFAETSNDFKQRWEAVSPGLPE
jgi:eukaryotic-like serine/threonine-protein kinase